MTRTAIYILLAFFMVAGVSCLHKKKQLTIKDLIFPDPEKQARVKKHIFSTTSIDTGCWDKRSQKAMLDSLVKNKVQIDSFGIIGSDVTRYDASGNVIYYRNHACDFFCQYLGSNTNFVFDSLGMVVFSYGYRPDSIHYNFIPDSFKLRAFHQLFEDAYSNYTETFIFDSTGKLKFLLKHGDDTTYYSYDRQGRLIMIRKILRRSTHGVTTNTKQFFYKNELLDSVIENTFDGSTNKYYYDSDGLLIKAVLHISEHQHCRNPVGWLKEQRTRLYYHLSQKLPQGLNQ